MKTQPTLRRHLCPFILLSLLVFLTACGTLEVSVKRTPTPDQVATATVIPTPAPLTILPGTVFEFVSYIHPHWGYQLSIPNGAKVTHSQEGRLTTFAYEDTDLIGGSYVLEVEIIPDPIMDSPDELLKWLTGGVDDPSPTRTVTANGGLISGAAISYAAGAGEWCPQMRALTAVFVAEGRGYVLRIKSDAPIRCDAETVPQTAPVVDSFRLLPADAYETSASALGKLAYVQGGDIWVKALPDGEPQRLTTDGRNSQPRWSPSGEWLAFRKGDYQVWLIRADGNDVHPLYERGPVSAFAWSPAEDRLAYVAGSDMLSLETINADSTDPVTLILPATGAVGRLGRIAWSPDGAWIAYEWLKQRPAQYLTYQGLWKVPANGGQRTELYASGAPEKGEAVLAGWSLDGQHIFFWQCDVLSASIMADGVALYSLPTSGGESIKLVDIMLVHDDFLAPAPQGNRLAVTAGEYRATWTNKRVAVVEADGSELTWLTDESEVAFSPAWSPDGVHLAYAAMPDRGDLVGGEDARLGMMERRIWVVNAQGKPQLQQITDDPAYRDERPLWSADGSHLLFARLDAEGRASLWLIPAGGGDPCRVVDELTPLPGPASGWFGYYGHVDWDQLFDWWRGPVVPQVQAPASTLLAQALGPMATYTDTEIGYALDYPAGWHIDWPVGHPSASRQAYVQQARPFRSIISG